jgi:predicted amidohydrolase
MRIAALQHDIVWEDRDATLKELDPQVRTAASSGVSMVVLTEMFATGFSMQTHLTAEPADGPTAAWLRERAEEHDVWMAGSVPLEGADGALPTNSLLVAGPDGTTHRYDKIHPFSYAGEHERFTPGVGDVVVEIEGVRWGLTVCYDLRFADQYWRIGTQVHAYLVVANWPSARREHWKTLLRARAIENQAYVVGVNRVGSGGAEGDLDYAGDSLILDPLGNELAAASLEPTMLLADIDAARVAEVRERFPFSQDR